MHMARCAAAHGAYGIAWPELVNSAGNWNSPASTSSTTKCRRPDVLRRSELVAEFQP